MATCRRYIGPLPELAMDAVVGGLLALECVTTQCIVFMSASSVVFAIIFAVLCGIIGLLFLGRVFFAWRDGYHVPSPDANDDAIEDNQGSQRGFFVGRASLPPTPVSNYRRGEAGDDNAGLVADANLQEADRAAEAAEEDSSDSDWEDALQAVGGGGVNLAADGSYQRQPTGDLRPSGGGASGGRPPPLGASRRKKKAARPWTMHRIVSAIDEKGRIVIVILLGVALLVSTITMFYVRNDVPKYVRHDKSWVVLILMIFGYGTSFSLVYGALESWSGGMFDCCLTRIRPLRRLASTHPSASLVHLVLWMMLFALVAMLSAPLIVAFRAVEPPPRPHGHLPVNATVESPAEREERESVRLELCGLVTAIFAFVIGFSISLFSRRWRRVRRVRRALSSVGVNDRVIDRLAGGGGSVRRPPHGGFVYETPTNAESRGPPDESFDQADRFAEGIFGDRHRRQQHRAADDTGEDVTVEDQVELQGQKPWGRPQGPWKRDEN